MYGWAIASLLFSYVQLLALANPGLPAVHTFGIPLDELADLVGLSGPKVIVDFTVLGTDSVGGTTVAYGLAGNGEVNTQTARIDASLFIQTSPHNSFVCAEHPGGTDSLECTIYRYSTVNGQSTVVPVETYTAKPLFAVVTQSFTSGSQSITLTTSLELPTTTAPSVGVTGIPPLNSKQTTTIIAASVTSASVALILIILVMVYLRRRRRIAKLTQDQLSPYVQQDRLPTLLEAKLSSRQYFSSPTATPLYRSGKRNMNNLAMDIEPSPTQSSGRSNPDRKRAAHAAVHTSDQRTQSGQPQGRSAENLREETSEVALAMRVATILQDMRVIGQNGTIDDRQGAYPSAPPPMYQE